MKKTIVVIAALALSTLALQSTNAQEIVRSNETRVQTVDYTTSGNKIADRVEIKKEELPEPVQKILESDALAGTEFVSAFVSDNEGRKIYEVTLRKEDNEVVLKFDEAGNIMH